MNQTMQIRVEMALGEATKEAGSGEFLDFLQKGDLKVVTDVELRYFGTAEDGYLDLTKRLDGDVFGISRGGVPPAKKSKDKMSTTTLVAILCGVVGGLVLLALIAALAISARKRSRSEERTILTRQWKTQRELGK